MNMYVFDSDQHESQERAEFLRRKKLLQEKEGAQKGSLGEGLDPTDRLMSWFRSNPKLWQEVCRIVEDEECTPEEEFSEIVESWLYQDGDKGQIFLFLGVDREERNQVMQDLAPHFHAIDWRELAKRIILSGAWGSRRG